MQTGTIASGEADVLDEVETSRGQGYLLLSTLLARPPSDDLLRRIGGLLGGPGPWGRSLDALAREARATAAAAEERDFNRLFIGVNRGELVPYASFYITGFLHDRPLVEIRTTMARLGIARQSGVAEPEDHAAALLEIMGGLILGAWSPPAAPDAQQAFFERHLAPWLPTFFGNLEAARRSGLYKAVGEAGTLLLEIERKAFLLT